MKSFFLLAVCCGLVSCEKAREMAGRFAKKPAAEAPASVSTGPIVTDITQGEYDSFRDQPGKVVLIDFYADWCGPCRKLSPMLDELAREHQGRIVIGKVNVDQNRELADREGVRGIPDVRVFRDGRQVDQFTGLPPSMDALKERLASHIKSLPQHAPATGETKPETPQPSTQPMSKDWMPPGMQRR